MLYKESLKPLITGTSILKFSYSLGYLVYSDQNVKAFEIHFSRTSNDLIGHCN